MKMWNRCLTNGPKRNSAPDGRELGLAMSSPRPLIFSDRRLGKLDLAEDRQVPESSLNHRVGVCVALDHKRDGRIGCLVRVAGIEGRRRVVLDTELDCLRDFRPSDFSNDAECEVNTCRDATRSEDIAVAHDP